STCRRTACEVCARNLPLQRCKQLSPLEDSDVACKGRQDGGFTSDGPGLSDQQAGFHSRASVVIRSTTFSGSPFKSSRTAVFHRFSAPFSKFQALRGGRERLTARRQPASWTMRAAVGPCRWR